MMDFNAARLRTEACIKKNDAKQGYARVLAIEVAVVITLFDAPASKFHKRWVHLTGRQIPIFPRRI